MANENLGELKGRQIEGMYVGIFVEGVVGIK